MKSSTHRLSSFRDGFLDTLPIAVSAFPFGAIFGMLSLKTGLDAWQSVAMSLTVFAGAAQFTALSMIAEQASIWAIVLATFLLNARHFLMGLSLAPHYRTFSTGQLNWFAFFLTDETYAIVLNRLRRQTCDAAYVLGSSLTLYVSWCGGNGLGTLTGQWLPDPEALGLGFAFIAMFLALAYSHLTSMLRVAAFLACGAVAVALSLMLPTGLPLVAAGLTAFAIGYVSAGRTSETGQESVREVESA